MRCYQAANELSRAQACVRAPRQLYFCRKPSAKRFEGLAVSTALQEEVMLSHAADGPSTSAAKLVGFEDGTYTVEGTVTTSASAVDVWEVLTDYEELAAVFSNILSSKLVSREPQITLHQECKWEFLIFSGKFGTDLSVKEDWEQGCLTFNLIQSSFMNNFVGQWRIKPLKGGKGSLVEHRLTVEPLVAPPAFMASYTQRIFVQQVASILRDLEEHMAGNAAETGEFQFSDL